MIGTKLEPLTLDTGLAEAAMPSPSPDAIRLATHLMGTPAIKTVLLCPVSRKYPAWRTVGELALGLAQLHHTPVLILELNDGPCQISRHLASGSESAIERVTIPCSGDKIFVSSGDFKPIVVAHLETDGGDLVPVLSSPAFASLMRSVRDRFAYVLINAPSVLESVTPLVIAPLCDGTILSVRANATRTVDVQVTKAQLLGAKARILGFIYDQSPLI